MAEATRRLPTHPEILDDVVMHLVASGVPRSKIETDVLLDRDGNRLPEERRHEAYTEPDVLIELDDGVYVGFEVKERITTRYGKEKSRSQTGRFHKALGRGNDFYVVGHDRSGNLITMKTDKRARRILPAYDGIHYDHAA